MIRLFGSIVLDGGGRWFLQIRMRDLEFEKRYYTQDAARLERVLQYIEHLGKEAARAQEILKSFDYQKVLETEENMRQKALKEKPQNKMRKKKIENKAGTWVHDPERPKDLPIGGVNNGKEGNAKKEI